MSTQSEMDEAAQERHNSVEGDAEQARYQLLRLFSDYASNNKDHVLWHAAELIEWCFGSDDPDTVQQANTALTHIVIELTKRDT